MSDHGSWSTNTYFDPIPSLIVFPHLSNSDMNGTLTKPYACVAIKPAEHLKRTEMWSLIAPLAPAVASRDSQQLDSLVEGYLRHSIFLQLVSSAEQFEAAKDGPCTEIRVDHGISLRYLGLATRFTELQPDVASQRFDAEYYGRLPDIEDALPGELRKLSAKMDAYCQRQNLYSDTAQPADFPYKFDKSSSLSLKLLGLAMTEMLPRNWDEEDRNELQSLLDGGSENLEEANLLNARVGRETMAWLVSEQNPLQDFEVEFWKEVDLQNYRSFREVLTNDGQHDCFSINSHSANASDSRRAEPPVPAEVERIDSEI